MSSPVTPTDFRVLTNATATSPSRGRNNTTKSCRTYNSKTIKRARHLRKNQTDAERLLWYYLRDFRESGFHFRRQVPIGNYIVDFACLKEKLIIEVDGTHHNNDENIAYDKQRTGWLKRNNFRSIRFDNSDIFTQIDVVLHIIDHQLTNHEK